MKKVLLVKYGEIALRGKNRGIYENKLVEIIKKNIKYNPEYSVKREQGRFLVEKLDDSDVDYDYLIPRIVNVFGLIGICKCIKIENQDIENLRQSALAYVKENFSGMKFSYKVESRRADKTYPMISRDISADIGGYILENMSDLTVDVHNPDKKIWIELRRSAYIYSDTIKGFGGLPVGSSGKGTLLLSGGIDSPVAGFLAAKRGVELNAVYFDSPPYTSSRALDKVMDLAVILSGFIGGIELFVVPFTELQLLIKESVPPEKMTIIMKRVMLKIAEKIAEKTNSQALFTGDSIGQVASQTMQSLYTISSAVDMQIIRPLACFDKQEISDIAEKIGTYDISIRPYEDCCTIFLAEHPETRPKKSIIESFEKSIIGLDEAIEKAIELTVTHKK